MVDLTIMKAIEDLTRKNSELAKDLPGLTLAPLEAKQVQIITALYVRIRTNLATLSSVALMLSNVHNADKLLKDVQRESDDVQQRILLLRAERDRENA